MPKKRKQHKKQHSKFFLKYIFPFAFLSGVVYFSLPYLGMFFSYVNDSTLRIIGFSVDNINISGAKKKTIQLINQNMQITKGDNIFKLSSEEIFNNVSKVTWVKSAVVQKILPNTINIKIEERKPIAVFQTDLLATLIDEDGKFIEEVKAKPSGIPIVSGNNANIKAKDILELISKFKNIRDNLDALLYVRERRWDIIVSGIKILLPENDVEKALEILSIVLKSEKINKNTVNQIDLRSPDNVVFNNLKFSNQNII